MMFRSGLILAAMAASLAGPALAEGDAAAGEQSFAKCKACHQVGPNARNGAGPVLNGVIGHQVASVEGFRYSPALTEKHEEGMVWDEENLAEWLTNPRAYIPGNRMSFPGIRDEQELQDVIAYLATLGES
jgi:cytochrome c